MSGLRHQGLDHVAIVVDDTESALALWRDVLGFPVVVSEVVNEGSVRLTHLDIGNAHLQLVQPLAPEHPLRKWLAEHGSGLHHVCFKVDDLDSAVTQWSTQKPHQAVRGKRAVFLDSGETQGIVVELTGD